MLYPARHDPSYDLEGLGPVQVMQCKKCNPVALSAKSVKSAIPLHLVQLLCTECKTICTFCTQCKTICTFYTKCYYINYTFCT